MIIFTTPTQSDADVNMASFRKTRDPLAIAFDACYINEEEFMLLWDAYKSKNLDFPVENYPLFNLEDKDPSEFVNFVSRKTTFRLFLKC